MASPTDPRSPDRSSGTLQGQTIGRYTVGHLLGAGGMGEVYRATDTVLKRAVALKVLPSEVSTHPERLARFRREAELLAALNHPHIAHVYGLENSAGTLALAMELVDGETLAARIARGPIAVKEAMAIADQIADALDAAHDQGIIHRDLKPANVKIGSDGNVKVLDFGLAKAVDAGALQETVTMDAPTIGANFQTSAGVVLGTATYMSPEQLKGEPADKRADIWAFGCVLYEMLTGRPPFSGDNFAAVSASIIRDTPDWTKLPPLPRSIRALVEGCLEKNPRARTGDIAVARFAIDSSRQDTTAAPPAAAVVAARSSRGWLPWAITAIAVAIAAGSIALPGRITRPSSNAQVRLIAPLVPGATIRAARGADLAMSRDGSVIAAIATTDKGPQLFLRRLDQPAFVPIADTIDSRMPFFSPDGKWVGYFVEPKLYKVPVAGGAPTVVCEGIEDPAGASWGDDDRIIFGRHGTGLWSVPASGGSPVPLLKQPGAKWPHVMPGGRGLVFTQINGGPKPPDVMAQELPSGTPKLLVNAAYFAKYSATGHLVYGSRGALYAAPFDATNLSLKGDGVLLVPGVSGTTGGSLWTAQYSLSDTGTVIFTTGGAAANLDRSPMTLISRVGVRSTLLEGIAWSNAAFSPDGHAVAFGGGDPSKASDIIILDLHNGATRQLTLDSENDHASPAWSPDGKKIVFAARRHGTAEPFNMYWRNADGSGSIHRLTTSPALQFPGNWHPSGKWIVYHEIKGGGAGDILALPVKVDTNGITAGAPQAIVASDYQELDPSFSPDGKFVAYSSNEGGGGIFVRPFQGTGGPWKVAVGGRPVWSPGKNELLFASSAAVVNVARYTASDATFRVEQIQPWPGAVLAAGQFRRLAVAPDSDHIAAGLIDPNADQSVNVVLHMLDGVKPPQ